MPQIANQEVPTATLPRDLSKANHPITTGSTYKPMDTARESIRGLLDMTGNTFRLIDAISKPQPTGPPNTSPSTSNSPTITPHSAIRTAFSSLFKDTSADTGNLQPPPLVPEEIFSTSLEAATRVYQTNEIVLRTSIQKMYEHLRTVPENDSSYPFIQSVLGLSLLHLYEVTWDDDALDAGCEGTSLALQKLSQLPDIQKVQSGPTVVRCWAYGQRLIVQKDGDVDKLEAALAILRKTWNIYKNLPGVPSRVMEFLRIELGMCLADHYRCTGNLNNLNDAIDHLLALTEDKVTSNPATVALGLAYYDRFLHLGVLDDLDRALHRGQGSCFVDIALSPSIDSLYNADDAAGEHLFSQGLAERFKMTMDIEDLDNAVKHCNKAIQLLHPSHPLRLPYTASLATILYARHDARATGSEDLQRALEIIRSALATIPDNLGRHSRVPADAITGFLTVIEGEERKDTSAIDAGISQIQKSRKSFSGPPHLESRIENYLSKAILCCFHLLRNKEDFELAIHHAQLAFSKAPDDSPYRFQCGLDLGRLLFEKYESGQSTHCDDAVAQFFSVAVSSSTWPSIRLKAAIEWTNAAEASHADGARDALATALDILPTLASLSNRMPAQYRLLSSQKSSIPNRAAIYALDSGDVVEAISCLEKGRNIIWAQALQLRAGHMLPAGDERRHELKLLSEHFSRVRHGPTQLGSKEEIEDFMKHAPPNPLTGIQASVARDFTDVMKKLVELGGESHAANDFGALKDFKDEYRNIYMDSSLHSSAERWTVLCTELQDRQETLAFSDAQKEDLIPILIKGPIVIVSAYALRCDAIIISTKGDGIDFHHLPLPYLSGDEIQAWAETLRLGMHDYECGEIPLDEFESEYLNPILRGLWMGLALPLLSYFKQIEGGKRVWWYPTGPLMFLPIHAASSCEGDEPGLLDLLVSSYIPSIHSLIRASKAPPLPLKVLAVGLPNTPGHTPLKYVDKEIKALKKHFRENPDSLTTLIGEEANIYPVISKLPEHSCVHLSCHAYQDEEYPFNSALFLHNGKLKLSSLMSLDLSRVQFAFLSACLTSAGDTSLPDECIHLAAGMQFGGVGSVIGTMWSVMDRVAATAASKVYGHLFRNGIGNVNMAEGAEALHEAIIEMRQKKLPLTYIVPFIHLGF